jgi:hypothetical protein
MTPQLVLDESTQHRLKTARANARSTENMQDWCIPASLQRMPQIGGPGTPSITPCKIFSGGELFFDVVMRQALWPKAESWRARLMSIAPLKAYRGVRAGHLQLVVCSCITPLGKLLQV